MPVCNRATIVTTNYADSMESILLFNRHDSIPGLTGRRARVSSGWEPRARSSPREGVFNFPKYFFKARLSAPRSPASFALARLQARPERERRERSTVQRVDRRVAPRPSSFSPSELFMDRKVLARMALGISINISGTNELTEETEVNGEACRAKNRKEQEKVTSDTHDRHR